MSQWLLCVCVTWSNLRQIPRIAFSKRRPYRCKMTTKNRTPLVTLTSSAEIHICTIIMITTIDVEQFGDVSAVTNKMMLYQLWTPSWTQLRRATNIANSSVVEWRPCCTFFKAPQNKAIKQFLECYYIGVCYFVVAQKDRHWILFTDATRRHQCICDGCSIFCILLHIIVIAGHPTVPPMQCQTDKSRCDDENHEHYWLDQCDIIHIIYQQQEKTVYVKMHTVGGSATLLFSCLKIWSTIS
jgi:hypothetical protein